LSLAPEAIPPDDQYRADVRESDEIDRGAWAKLLAELLAAGGFLTPEQASAPIGPISANWRTIRRWLTQEQGVTARSVRDVCRELHYPPVDALVRVGFLTATEAKLSRSPAIVSPPLPPPLRQIADVLTDRRIPPNVKAPLQDALRAAFDAWADMLKLHPPKEPRLTGRDRTPHRPT
jgi:hypothetical protein